AKNLELDAKLLGEAELQPKSGDSPFQAAVKIGTYDVKSDRKPPKFTDVLDNALGGVGKTRDEKESIEASVTRIKQHGKAQIVAQTTMADAVFNEYRAAMIATSKDPETLEEQLTRLEASRNEIKDALKTVYPGAILNVADDNAPLPYALVQAIHHDKKTKNPYASSSWSATLAMPGYGVRHGVPFSQLNTTEEDLAKRMKVKPSTITIGELGNLFDSFKKEMRERRVIATGNILAAFDLLKNRGQIANFTTDTGEVKQGIIMPRAIIGHGALMSDIAKRLTTENDVVGSLKSGEKVSGDNGVIEARSLPNDYVVINIAAAKAIGGKYFLDPGVMKSLNGRDFVKRSGDGMAVRIDMDEA